MSNQRLLTETIEQRGKHRRRKERRDQGQSLPLMAKSIFTGMKREQNHRKNMQEVIPLCRDGRETPHCILGTS